MAVQASLCFENFSVPTYWMDGNNNNSFIFQHPHEGIMSFQPQNMQEFGNFCNQGVFSSEENLLSSMAFSPSLDAQLGRQNQEINCFLRLQNERLSSAMQEQRKRQLGVLLNTLESKGLVLMRQKGEELLKANNKTMELQECLNRLQMESQAWQKLTRDKEAMVVNLHNTIEQAKEKLRLIADDAESSCNLVDENRKREFVCKVCNTRSSCILFLPCRHLCSCKYCETFLGSCPVCDSVKQGSMEVLWS